MARKKAVPEKLYQEFSDRLMDIVFQAIVRDGVPKDVQKEKKTIIDRLEKDIYIGDSSIYSWMRGSIDGDKPLLARNVLKIIEKYLGQQGLESVQDVWDFLSLGHESYLELLTDPVFLKRVEELHIPPIKPGQQNKMLKQMGLLPACQDYVARTQEMEVVEHLVKPDGPKAVLLYGARGMGKTQLLRYLSSANLSLQKRFPDGIFMLDLDNLTIAILHMILLRAGIKLREKELEVMEEHAILEAWAAWISNPGLRALFIFDNLNTQQTAPAFFDVTGKQVRFLMASKEKGDASLFLKRIGKDGYYSIAVHGFGDEEVRQASDSLPEHPDFENQGDLRKIYRIICERVWGYPGLVMAARKIALMDISFSSSDDYFQIMLRIDDWMNFRELRDGFLSDLQSDARYVEYLSECYLNEYHNNFDDSLLHAEEITGLQDQEVRNLIERLCALGLARKHIHRYEIHPIFWLGKQQEPDWKGPLVLGPVWDDDL